MLDSTSADLCQSLVGAVTDELTWQVAGEALEEARWTRGVVEGACQEEAVRLLQAVTSEVVAEVARSVWGGRGGGSRLVGVDISSPPHVPPETVWLRGRPRSWC